MKYYKSISDGYIVSIGTGEGGTEITEAEYNSLASTIAERPAAPDGYGYQLKTDLTWELYELPPDEAPVLYSEETLAAMTNAELEAILYSYGITATMNKANMVRLILNEQGGGSQ